MNTVASTIIRASCRSGSRVTAATASALQTTQRRSTSWIAWEQPNPALYAPPPRAPPANETQEAASKTQDTRSVGATVTAPATAVVMVGGSQEVSTSGKTIPSSIQAGTSRLPSSQTRSTHSQTPTADNDPACLPTTLLRIPGCTASWPGATPEHPDQKRVRVRTVHEHSGPERPPPPPESTNNNANGDDDNENENENENENDDDDEEKKKVLPPLGPAKPLGSAVQYYLDNYHSRAEAQAATQDLRDSVQTHLRGADRARWEAMIQVVEERRLEHCAALCVEL
ncbi:hypothetical protein M426DRAFT_8963 [Hypoxylon sp. CI-4A]|nr:hypothetical protein M426DRAFT_8963 [Hypoxylon sp. CI-4A]